MAIFLALAGARGATLRVKCPHCGKVQVRARGKEHYRCNACHKAIEPPKGSARSAPAGARRPR